MASTSSTTSEQHLAFPTFTESELESLGQSIAHPEEYVTLGDSLIEFDYYAQLLYPVPL